MSGVIDDNGVQWERCNSCAGWVRFEELYYQAPRVGEDHGWDLCPECWRDRQAGDTESEARRRERNLAEQESWKREYESTPTKQSCGHLQIPSRVVREFFDRKSTADGSIMSVRAKSYCSQACADADAANRK